MADLLLVVAALREAATHPTAFPPVRAGVFPDPENHVIQR
jgi:hypothetical protein